jgi:hypothetical protein
LADCAVQSDGPFQFVAAFGTAYVRYGFSRHISASLQANASAPLLDWSVGTVGAQLGAKYYFGRAGALRLCAAYPLRYGGPTLGLSYLFDFNKSWTGSAGVGTLVGSGWSGSGASLGVDYHFPLSGSMRCHFATVAAVAPVGGEGASLSFGIGIDRAPPENTDGDQEEN